MSPRTAARMFFAGGHAGQRGLLDISGWQHLSVTAAAQAVQHSAYPDAYAKWEPLAVRLVRNVAHVDTGCTTSGGWVYPLGNAPKVLTAGFGNCGSLWAYCHTGQDFAVPTGTPVQAAGDGSVVFAGWGGAYGNLVEILHAGGIATWYARLSRLETHRGAHVRAGQLVGLRCHAGSRLRALGLGAPTGTWIPRPNPDARAIPRSRPWRRPGRELDRDRHLHADGRGLRLAVVEKPRPRRRVGHCGPGGSSLRFVRLINQMGGDNAENWLSLA